MQHSTGAFSVGFRLVSLLLAGLGGLNAAYAAETLKEAIHEGKVNGNIRIHYNERHYASRPDETAFALGGGLRAETGRLVGVKVGVGLYTAQDLGLNDSDPIKVDSRMGSDVLVLGEAYVNYSAWDSSSTIGRQKVNTPFANPIDVFIIPFTYDAVSIKNKTIPNLTLEMAYLDKIKSAGSGEFVNVGIWSTSRLGVTPTETSGTFLLGGKYKRGRKAIQAWWYEFSDLFFSRYLQADYAFALSGNVKPFISAQVIHQGETGDALLGEVDSMVYGLKGGIGVGKAELSLGYTQIAENSDAFKNGAFLAPYNFSTSPLYTNSMLQNMENNDAGEGLKLTLLFEVRAVKVRLSYAHLDFAVLPDLDATDFDLTYSLNNYVKGLSLRYRVEFVNSDSDAVEQSDNRLQLQYVF